MSASPYRGLAPFDTTDDDASLFFGRDREIAIVTANLHANRLTVLYGASGVGKSSLLRAGVVHRLRAEKRAEGPRHVVAMCSSWSGDPVAAVTSAVAEAVTGAVGNAVTLTPGRSLGDELGAWCELLGGDISIVLDQFEEYLLYHGGSDGGPLAEVLADVVSRRGLRVGVLLGVRDDALAELDGLKPRIPALFGNLLRLEHLTREEARTAIVGPLERLRAVGAADVVAEDQLVDEVLDQVATGRIAAADARGALVAPQGEHGSVEAPYLQLVMERVWQVERKRGSSTLRASTLADLGGAVEIVQDHLERALAMLDEGGREIAAATFGLLVTPSGTKIAHRADDLARYAGVDPAELQRVLDVLTGQRILRRVFEEHGTPPRYEIFHDVLASPMLAWSDDFATARAVLAERRRRRRVVGIGAVVAAGILALVVAAAGAFVERERAGTSSKQAASRRLDASSAALLASDPELSLLLAAEAAGRAPGPTTEDALRNALLASRIRAVFDLGAPVEAVAHTTDGSRFGGVGANGLVRVWDASTHRLLVDRRVASPGGLAFTTAGAAVIRGADAPPVVVHRDGTGCALGRDPVAGLAVARDRVVLSSGAVYRADTCARVQTVHGIGRSVGAVVASGDGTRAAFVTRDRARFVALPSGRLLGTVRHPTEIRGLVLDDAGRLAVTVAANSQIANVWDTASGRLVRTLAGHVGDVVTAAIDPAGDIVATGSNDGQARVWDVASGNALTVLSGHLNFVDSIDVGTDGTYVVTGSPDRTARTWTNTGRLVAVLAGDSGAITGVSFVGDGTTVLTGSEDGTVRLWDAGTSNDLVGVRTPAPPAPVLEATSPDGATTARATGPVIRITGPRGIVQLVGHRADVTSVAFSPDGRRLVSASRDNDAIIWDTETGDALRVLRAHFGPVFDARYSPDGRWIVTAGPITAGLWNAANGAFVRYLRGAPKPLAAASFLPDSRTIVTQSRDGTVSRYLCLECGTTSELRALAETRLHATGRTLTREERELYLG